MPDDYKELGREEVSGEVQRIYFRNEATLYTIAGVDAKEGRLTVLGYFPQLLPGQRYSFVGRWTVHPKYGEQFRAQSCQEILPTTKEGIRAYLGGGLIPGVGEKLAARLVEHFGEATLDIIGQEPERLTEVPGIGKKIAAKIRAAVEENRELERVMVFLQGHGITPNLSLKIYRQYGDQALDVVRENPYSLTEDIFGVGFATADRIARHMGVFLHDPFRLQAGLRHVLTNACYQKGHCYLPEKELLLAAVKLLNSPDIEEPIEEEEVMAALDTLLGEGEFLREDGRIYLPALFNSEIGLAGRLRQLAQRKYDIDEAKVQWAIGEVEKELDFTLAPQQIEVIYQSLQNGVLVVTGGPGTGKSTIVAGIIHALLSLDGEAEILLAAPTGRAAKRLSELTGMEAKTIHRLLGFRWEEGRGEFSVGLANPLEGQLLVVDEFSMVDLPLAHHLFQAVPAGMRVVLVGDVDQLPSVGPGRVLHDIITAETIPTVRLGHIFRQAEASRIVTNAHRINRGQMIDSSRNQGDFLFLPQEEPEAALEGIRLIIRRILQSLPLEEVQVISPMHNHILGVENLNRVLQAELNPPGPTKREYQVGKTTFRQGDKVMAVKNNYDKGVFNGNLGLITNILLAREVEELKEDTLTVEFDGELVCYGRSELDELTLAYAVTVHKSQGSEFDFCLFPLSTQHWYMLQRNLFYTAVTRGKKMVVLIGSKRALRRAIRNDSIQHRYTYLGERLKGQVEDGI
ncbi:MAG: ATP-dependent RecD-like DNA helicase [Firmicutes bacterium]|nr:ATP-dependent RecD-like DNA helicase [Bacillota bacterium]